MRPRSRASSAQPSSDWSKIFQKQHPGELADALGVAVDAVVAALNGMDGFNVRYRAEKTA